MLLLVFIFTFWVHLHICKVLAAEIPSSFIWQLRGRINLIPILRLWCMWVQATENRSAPLNFQQLDWDLSLTKPTLLSSRKVTSGGVKPTPALSLSM